MVTLQSEEIQRFAGVTPRTSPAYEGFSSHYFMNKTTKRIPKRD